MATVSLIKTTGGDYSLPETWLADFASGGWIGEVEGEVTTAAGVSFSGHSTSSSDYIILRGKPGATFRDNAGAATNPLKYDATKGAAITGNIAYGYTVVVPIGGDDYVTVENLQIKNTVDAGFAHKSFPGSNCIFRNLIVEQVNTSDFRYGTYSNMLLILRSSSGNGVNFAYSSAKMSNLTVVRPNGFTVGGTAFNGPGGGDSINNCAAFGFSSFTNGSPSGDYNASDASISFGSHNQASLSYASQFESYADSTRDFRTKAGSAMIDAGFTNTTDVPSADDIIGTARPSGSAWDIGVWEFVSGGGGGSTIMRRLQLLGAG